VDPGTGGVARRLVVPVVRGPLRPCIVSFDGPTAGSPWSPAGTSDHARGATSTRPRSSGSPPAPGRGGSRVFRRSRTNARQNVGRWCTWGRRIDPIDLEPAGSTVPGNTWRRYKVPEVWFCRGRAFPVHAIGQYHPHNPASRLGLLAEPAWAAAWMSRSWPDALSGGFAPQRRVALVNGRLVGAGGL